MSTVVASSTLAAGLLTEFADTYTSIRNRQQDSRLGLVMDLGLQATTRRHDMAYFEAAPHMALWRRGDTIPTDAMLSKTFSVTIYNWAMRVPWHKDDRDDDQTQSLMDAARAAGESAGLLPERFFFDLLAGTTNTLPATPNAPDGASFFSTTDGGSANRFGISSGNLLTGSGIATTAAVQDDYYAAIEQFKGFQDGKGQPLFSDERIDAGTIIIHAAADTEVFEETFLQRRQGVLGPDNATDAVTSVQVSNVVQDASRNVTLWGTSRLATGDWYVFLKNPPKKPTFLITRKPLQEFSALADSNNSDHSRDTGEEYVQWEERSGAGIALPYGAIKVNS